MREDQPVCPASEQLLARNQDLALTENRGDLDEGVKPLQSLRRPSFVTTMGITVPCESPLA